MESQLETTLQFLIETIIPKFDAINQEFSSVREDIRSLVLILDGSIRSQEEKPSAIEKMIMDSTEKVQKELGELKSTLEEFKSSIPSRL